MSKRDINSQDKLTTIIPAITFILRSIFTLSVGIRNCIPRTLFKDEKMVIIDANKIITNETSTLPIKVATYCPNPI